MPAAFGCPERDSCTNRTPCSRSSGSMNSSTSIRVSGHSLPVAMYSTAVRSRSMLCAAGLVRMRAR
ncbi:hypothetical protein SUDANB176_06710 [Streptomyces sp. enrichment culture]